MTSAGAALLGVSAVRLDVAAHLAPIWLGAGVISILAAALIRGRRLRLFVLACGGVASLAAGWLMAPEYLRRLESRAPPDAAGQIKVIQFNAYKHNGDINRVVDWLVAQSPDIVTLQEARHDLRDELLRRTGWSVAGRKEHVMIFSRDWRLREVRPPLKNGELTYISATYASPTGPFEVVTTHFDWPTAPTFAGQHEDLAQLVSALPRDRMILTGDLNTTPWSNALRQTDAALGLRRVDRALFSWPARLDGKPWPLPVLPIDHVYVGRGWRVVRIERGPYLGSDHYPLVITLAPASPP